ncbi:CoA transferase [Pseudonocardia sp. KRD291]|uniref:CoA transferase n=1 Tax=Pseudonocardia sp. KRD291 TaxID=2792007 RepID=UPI001C4A0721|nr:CoA transferase [Pseudonocardia sp. KRD291]MBW0101214.1 CoA transferase [Pseudonocardia sp. KRD291]
MTASAEVTALPLDGVRIVDLTTGLAGPFATRVLAEAGADVVKVEPPGGDPARDERPAGFATWNRSKRSVILDLDTQDGRDALENLLGRADVLAHDLPHARARALGLDPDSVATRLPDVLVATVPSYPAGHPLQDLGASDAMVQAAQGFMDEQQGHRDGPVYIRMPFPSWCAGYLLATGIVARLVQRARHGVVLPVATSVFQGGLAPAALYWQRWERLPPSLTRHTLPKIWPDAALSIFGCSDGRYVQLAGAVGGWIESPPVLEALALADLVDLSEVGVTPQNWETWDAVFRARSSRWWLDALNDADVPCVLVHELGECFTDEQALGNDYVVEVDDPVIGPALQAAAPVATTPAARVPAPVLGTSTVDEVLAGWTAREPAGYVSPPTGDPRPLAGLRVLDFGSVVAGPFGAQCLGDLGADVVKVEPLAGDRGRGLTQFAGCHRAKRSLAIDLKAPVAREVLERLVRSSDVVLHNMRLGPAARLGLDGPGLAATNPDIVFSHVSAYGPRGPMATFPGYDPTAQAMTGWEHANAGVGRTPTWLRNSVFDVQAGLAGALGALLGLHRRATTGTPGEAATSLLAVGINAASEVAVALPARTVTPYPVLSADQTGLDDTHRLYQLADGWILVDAGDQEQTRAFRELLGPDAGRPAEALSVRSVQETLTDLEDAGVAATSVGLDQLDAFMESPVHRELGLSRCLRTRGFGAIDLVAGFWSLGAAPEGESVPDLGEHSREVLAELGYDAAALEPLVDGGVVRLAAPVSEMSA